MIINITPSLGNSVGLLAGVPSIKVSVQEDNDGALILARTLPPKYRPCSKYYATKKIWFREYTNKRKIALLKIARIEQLGDLFTRGISRAKFEYLRNKIMGS